MPRKRPSKAVQVSAPRVAPWVLSTVVIGYLSVLLIKLSHAPVWLPGNGLPLALILGAFLVVYGGFRVCRLRPDPALLGMAMLLAGLGVLLQFRLGSYGPFGPFPPSAYVLPASTLVMVLVATAFRGRRLLVLRWLGWPAWLVSVALITVILVLGQRFRGAVFLPGNINPSEPIKVLLVLTFAAFLTRHRDSFSRATTLGLPCPHFGSLLGLGMLWGVPAVLLVIQRDLGMLVLVSGSLVLMLYVATDRPAYLLLATGAVVGAGALLYLLGGHASGRLLAWHDPFGDPTGRGWQILQGFSAMYSGGVWGVGLGAGSPLSVPIATSDFVYAALAEELGFAGCLILLAAYALILVRGFRIAASWKDPFGGLFVAGLTGVVGLQVLVNVGGVTKVLPMTGVTLPFVSHGGSSLATSFVILALLLAASCGEKGGSASRARRPSSSSRPRRRRSTSGQGTRPRSPRRSSR